MVYTLQEAVFQTDELKSYRVEFAMRFDMLLYQIELATNPAQRFSGAGRNNRLREYPH